MTNFATKINVGDRVRSFDFASTTPGDTYGRDLTGERAAFVEGVVESISEPWNTYAIRVTRRVFRGEEGEWSGDTVVHPPINGTKTSMGGITQFVERI